MIPFRPFLADILQMIPTPNTWHLHFWGIYAPKRPRERWFSGPVPAWLSRPSKRSTTVAFGDGCPQGERFRWGEQGAVSGCCGCKFLGKMVVSKFSNKWIQIKDAQMMQNENKPQSWRFVVAMLGEIEISDFRGLFSIPCELYAIYIWTTVNLWRLQEIYPPCHKEIAPANWWLEDLYSKTFWGP